MRVFRFDDININEDLEKTVQIASVIRDKIPDARVIFCISPMVNDMSSHNGKDAERIYPKIMNALSDHRNFYKVDLCGVPLIPDWVETAGHGLFHVDHRLLTKEAQEMSIISSCSLSKSSIFVPPFNKWNTDTEKVCEEFDIELVKFEDGWLCCEYNEFNPKHNLWYIHAREFTLKGFIEWIK